jgi:hypothetical protein
LKTYNTHPTELGETFFTGDYSELLKAGKIGATFNNDVGKFKPYGVLMLSVK